MKNLFFILIATFALIGCSSNPLKGTQWEGINGFETELQLVSFDEDTCTFYTTSSLNGKTSQVGLNYEINGNVITFTPINVHMEVYPTLAIDGDYLILQATKSPVLKKVSK